MDQIFRHRSAILEHLTAFLDKKKETPTNDWTADTLSRASSFINGGKTIRGCLAVENYRNLTNKTPEMAWPLAAALELLHATFLIHDDIMDQDNTRHGKPSMFAQYQSEASQKNWNNPGRSGESLAICVGDAITFMGYELLSELKIEASLHQSLVKFLSSEWQRVCWGQMADVAFAAQPNEPTLAEIEEMYITKTARYTFSVPLAASAMIAKQSPIVIESCVQLGIAWGLIFQIHDDLLNLTGDIKITGKPVASDIRENKRTYIRALLFANSPTKIHTELLQAFGNPQLTERQIIFVQKAVQSDVVQNQLSEKITQLQVTATNLINQLPISPAAQKNYHNLTTYLWTRVK